MTRVKPLVYAPRLWCTPDGRLDNRDFKRGEYIAKDGCGSRLSIMYKCANHLCRESGKFRDDLYRELDS